MDHALLAQAEELVKQRMLAYDSSHDWHHVNRVRKQGLNLYIIDCSSSPRGIPQQRQRGRWR
jgi:hypothetical protein